MSVKRFRLLALLALLGMSGAALSACNTIKGVGEDVSAVGKATSGAAEKTSEEIDKKTTTP
jgi:entericidin B